MEGMTCDPSLFYSVSRLGILGQFQEMFSMLIPILEHKC